MDYFFCPASVHPIRGVLLGVCPHRFPQKHMTNLGSLPCIKEMCGYLCAHILPPNKQMSRYLLNVLLQDVCNSEMPSTSGLENGCIIEQPSTSALIPVSSSASTPQRSVGQVRPPLSIPSRKKKRCLPGSATAAETLVESTRTEMEKREAEREQRMDHSRKEHLQRMDHAEKEHELNMVIKKNKIAIQEKKKALLDLHLQAQRKMMEDL